MTGRPQSPGPGPAIPGSPSAPAAGNETTTTDVPDILAPRGGAGRRLDTFTPHGYVKGRSVAWQVAWFAVSHLLFQAWWLPARLRPPLLRAFGARIGRGVHIRNGVRIHWPWKLTVGDHVWIGEGAWLLNLELITVANHVCLSQDSVLCTGSHDRDSPAFGFDNAPISVGEGAWVALRAVVLRGVDVPSGATVPAGRVVAYARDCDR